MLDCRWANEDFQVLPERALWWPRVRTLLIADLHLGKPASFRASGVPVPEAATDADLARISALLHRFSASRLVILGDLLHARSGRQDETMHAFARFRAAHARADVLLIRGNHDARAGDPPAEWNLRVESEPYRENVYGGIALAHDPRAFDGRPILCGHIHPAVALAGPIRSLRPACFWFGRNAAVLPAFGSFTGCRAVRPRPADRVFAVGEGEVVEVSAPRFAAAR